MRVLAVAENQFKQLTDVAVLVAGLTRILKAAKSEGRIFDSNVDMTAGGRPKLVATGNIWGQQITRVNPPLRAAHSAELAARTPATVKAHVVTAQTAIDPAEREAGAGETYVFAP